MAQARPTSQRRRPPPPANRTGRRPPPGRGGRRPPPGRGGRRPSGQPNLARVVIPVFLVVVVVLALVITKVAGGGGSPNAAAGTAQPAPAGVVDAVASLPATTFNTVGVPASVSSPPVGVKPPPPILTSGGKPEVVFMGAEYCPYCAAERWALTMALDRFGTFTNLKTTSSSSTDAYPNTQTLSYYGASYSSPYIVFDHTETENNQGQPLQAPTAQVVQLANKYDQPKYISGASPNTIPFIDVANRYIGSTTYSPQVLQGLSLADIVGALSNPASPVTQGIVGSANLYTAAICAVTGNQPGSVCSTPAVRTAAAKLK